MCVGIMGIEHVINSENDWNYKVFALFESVVEWMDWLKFQNLI